MKDATSTVLHTVLRHLEQHGAYARLLLEDCSSAFIASYPAGFLGRPATVIQDGPASLLYSDNQHRGPTRLCAEPVPLLSVYT